MKEDFLSVNRRAYRINQDSNIYGTFAEIGAGQEVARHFFQAGQASHTIAKTMSAYDMTFSDTIYGKGERYVSFKRLKNMLDHEFDLLQKRLSRKRAQSTCFFTFADTVTTSSVVSRDMNSLIQSRGPREFSFSKRSSKESLQEVSRPASCHGWMGIRFQLRPRGPQNDVILHVRMLDRFRLQQQEALGILGVNLIYSAFYLLGKNRPFISSLVSNLHKNRIEIDFLKVEGPDLKKWDPSQIHLDLVHQGLTEAILFGPRLKGKNHLFQMDEVFHNQSLFLIKDYLALEKKLTFKESKALLQKALKKKQSFKKKSSSSNLKSDVEKVRLRKKGMRQEAIQLIEMRLKSNQKEKKEFSDKEILKKIAAFTQLKIPVLVTSFSFPFHLRSFLRRYTQNEITFLMSSSALRGLFYQKKAKREKKGEFKKGNIMKNKIWSDIYLLETLSSWFDERIFFYVFCSKKEKSLDFFDEISHPLFKFLMSYKRILNL